MTLLSLATLAVAVVVLYKQNNRISSLESEMMRLRNVLPRAVTEASEPSTSFVQAEAPAANPPGPSVATVVERDERPAHAGPSVPVITLPLTVPSTPPRAPEVELATTLGTRWAVWVGGLALALGGIFLVRYSLESGLLDARTRLTLAALFALLLAAASEITRRRGFAVAIPGLSGPRIPAVLASASAFVLFGAVYAAHGIYGFIGPTLAFSLLAALGLAAIFAALLHGQAVAGFGLLGSYLTPALVSSQSPSPWAFFVHLAVVLAASVIVAWIRRWNWLAAGSYAGAGLWSLAYLFLAGSDADPFAVAFLQNAGLAILASTWARRPPRESSRRKCGVCVVAALFTAAVAVALMRGGPAPFAVPLGTIVLASMVVVAALRPKALSLLHLAAGSAVLLTSWDAPVVLSSAARSMGTLADVPGSVIDRHQAMLPSMAALAIVVLSLGVFLAVRRSVARWTQSVSWAVWAGLVPLSVIAWAWLLGDDPARDPLHAGLALALAVVLGTAAELAGRREVPAQRGGATVSALATGAAAAVILAIPMVLGPLPAIIVTSLCALVLAIVTGWRPWPVLGWLSIAFAGVALARVGLDPTIVGRDALSAVPFFNALLPAYFVPAVVFGLSAWRLAKTERGEPFLVMQAVTALFALLGAAMLVRHAMNGGVIDASEPRLAEQAIYTLLLVGGGAILLALDRRSPSVVLRWGSIILGALSVASIVLAHLFTLNPLFSGELLGTNPVFDLLFLAYALPALALGAYAYQARNRRPPPFVAMLWTASSMLIFAYFSLRIRRAFQGEMVGHWRGLGEIENYAYSAVWLGLGVLLLVGGLRWHSRTLRSASAALLVIAVAKVFLFDMRHLGGVLRPLSFIGLGGVLIGIGLFYQRMLARPGEAGPFEEREAT